MSRFITYLLGMILLIGILSYLYDRTENFVNPDKFPLNQSSETPPESFNDHISNNVTPGENEISDSRPANYPPHSSHPLQTRLPRPDGVETALRKSDDLQTHPPFPTDTKLTENMEQTASSPRSSSISTPHFSSTTLFNLQTALKNEINSSIKYMVYAEKARLDGYHSLATLFRAVAYSDKIHARCYEDMLRRVGADTHVETKTYVGESPEKMLQEAIQSETLDFTQIYPKFIQEAETDISPGHDHSDVSFIFRASLAAEAVHAQLFVMAFIDLEKWKIAGKQFSVCETCGFIETGKPQRPCPVCDSPPSMFQLFIK
ncbi:MAG: rubrerythrin family protein [Planctomycetia bacterium]|nr:rubrerythrin family protein [Planctomycetia bacterium]